MNRSPVVLSVAVALVGGVLAAQAGPCTKQISQVEAQIRRAQAQQAGAPSAPQSVAAQLHRQPTTQSVKTALNQANEDGVDVLNRAKKADAAGKAKECANALAEARQLYGLQ
jgi:hypothetical protein